MIYFYDVQTPIIWKLIIPLFHFNNRKMTTTSRWLVYDSCPFHIRGTLMFYNLWPLLIESSTQQKFIFLVIREKTLSKIFFFFYLKVWTSSVSNGQLCWKKFLKFYKFFFWKLNRYFFLRKKIVETRINQTLW